MAAKTTWSVVKLLITSLLFIAALVSGIGLATLTASLISVSNQPHPPDAANGLLGALGYLSGFFALAMFVLAAIFGMLSIRYGIKLRNLTRSPDPETPQLITPDKSGKNIH